MSSCFSPDGRLVASGSFEGSILLWDLRSPATPVQSLEKHHETVRSICFSNRGDTLCSGSMDEIVSLWGLDGNSWVLTNKFFEPGPVWCTRFILEERVLVAGGGDSGFFSVWDTQQAPDAPQVRATYTSPLHCATELGANGQLVVAAASDGVMPVYDTASGKLVRHITGHASRVNWVAQNADRTVVHSSSWSRSIQRRYPRPNRD